MLMEWLQWVCAPPWVLSQVDTILDRTPPRRWSADKLGKLLHVSDFERTALRIWTIGAHNVPKAKRIERRNEKRRLAAQARRQARGAKPASNPSAAPGRGKPLALSAAPGSYAASPPLPLRKFEASTLCFP